MLQRLVLSIYFTHIASSFIRKTFKFCSKANHYICDPEKKTSLIAVHVENDTNDVYIGKKSWGAKEKRNCLLFYAFLFFPDCETVLQTMRWQKTLSLAFLNAKMIYCYDGLQTQIYLYAENIFFSFYAKSFSGAFTNEFLFGNSLPGTVFYHNTCFLVCHSFLLAIAIRTSFF